LPAPQQAGRSNFGLAEVDARRIRNQSEQVEQAVEVEVPQRDAGAASAQAKVPGRTTPRASMLSAIRATNAK